MTSPFRFFLGARIAGTEHPCAVLHTDQWNDWYEFRTQFKLTVFDAANIGHVIGDVKIGKFGMAPDTSKIVDVEVPDQFGSLSEDYFSLGQGPGYYTALAALGEPLRTLVLKGLRDIADDLSILDRALKSKEQSLTRSLMREFTVATVRGQLHRVARGGAVLSGYDFTYNDRRGTPPLELKFQVTPLSTPPSNVHVLIGRNGVGKTELLRRMVLALLLNDPPPEKAGAFTSPDVIANLGLFANVVSVTFSAFDRLHEVPAKPAVNYEYIGLRNSRGATAGTKGPAELATEFAQTVKNVAGSPQRRARWLAALETLAADPNFRDADVSRLAALADEEQAKESETLFAGLSSGHAAVLLAITRLVEKVEERTLVLLDEPEAHLHPPLVAAYVRALADLLVDRNGVAIIATHSPVVLQEVPRSCVWKIDRRGAISDAERPLSQTFAENVGTLTSEVFGLEVRASGFHKLLSDETEKLGSFEAVIAKFSSEVGDEGKALVRGLLANPAAKK